METSIKLPNISPEISANPFSKLFFCWVLPFLKYAASHTLQFRDIYDTIEEDSSLVLSEVLEKNWNEELKKSRIKNRSPSLKNSLIYSFGYSFLLYALFLFIQSIFIRVLHPIVLAEYIKNFEEGNTEQSIGWYFAAVIIILALLNNLIYHHCFVGCSRIGSRISVACTSLIQKKIVKLSQYSLNRTAPQRLMKLVTEDVVKIKILLPHLPYLYVTPIQFLCSFYILFHTIGVSSLTGMAFMLIVSVPQGYISVIQTEIANQVSVFSASRLKTMKEILHGIHIIKMYGWEKPFEGIIEKFRKHELKRVSRKLFIDCLAVSSLMFTQTMATFVTLTTYVLLGNELQTHRVFSVVLIFHHLQHYMCYFFHQALQRYLDAQASIIRIENFLLMEEKEEQIKILCYSKGFKKPGSIIINEASAKWEIEPILKDVALTVNAKTSCCIFGSTGSGKSSLLELILKELPAIAGRIDVVGTVSYASQKPFYFASTIKTNILFGQPYNRHKYREIIKMCGLDKDFQKLPFGDQTLATDKMCLQNGLREKINLARCLYKDADIYLFDDLFESIDKHSSKQVFIQCITNYLENKTRVYVSKKLAYAKEAETIVILENGNVQKTVDTKNMTEEDIEILNSTLSINKDNFKSHDLIEETELNQLNEEEEKLNSKRGYFVTSSEFLKMGGKRYIVELVAVHIIIAQIFATLSDFWLIQWAKEKPKNLSETEIANFTNHNSTSAFRLIYHIIWHDVVHGLKSNNNTNFEDHTEVQLIFGISKTDFNIGIYAGFIICCIIFTAVRSLLYHTLCMNASRALHNNMFKKVLFAPMKFFESFPSGTILRRFSKDMDVVHNLPANNFITRQMYFDVCGTTLLVLFAAPVMMPPLLLFGIMIYFLMCAFVSTIRALQRLENKALVPINSFLLTSLNGVSTIRSSGAEQFVSEEFDGLLDIHTSIITLMLMTSEYFCFYMDFLIIIFMGATTFLAVIVKIENFDIGYTGIAVTYSLILTELLHLGIRESIEVICSNSSLDRTLQYTKLVSEDVEQSTLVPKNWPYCGKIVFKNVYLKDTDGHGSFLKNLNVVIKPSEKIALVSRDPEEKWTVVNSLLRLTPVEGIIILDDVDTSSISLNKLRSNITVITKDPVLFSASVRFNLDPLDYANDDMLWKVLEDVGLKTCIQSLSQPIIESGFNFSCGQRQLFCLARALLKNTKILIIENSLSNIDKKTEDFIQNIILEHFKNCTVLTVANNIKTIMDNDKILVIDEGKEVEYAHAYELLENPEGYLSQLVKDTGPEMEENLKKIAKENFESRNLHIQFQFNN